ncbi:SDR family oxidoreductase, partial [Luminiphilus sp.]|nr:SDR family oxidoreductase [Luminiphilus sp.]
MNFELAGKRVLVTGASRGIGFGIAEAFHLEGCTVVSNGRSAANLASSIAKRKGWFGVVGDVTDPLKANDVVRQAVDLLGGIDVLVCNVGSGKSVPPGQENFTDWQESLSVNLLSATNMVEAAVSELRKTKGVVVCISSICGIEVVRGAPVTYSAAKAALNAYIRGISLPLGTDGVRINGIAPGNILFDGSVWDEKIKKNASGVEQMLVEQIPLRRLGVPADVTNLVLWLSSPLSSFNTGSIHVCDGGQTRS